MADFSSLAHYFQSYGVMDFLLPFLLVFTIIFAVTAKLPLFKDNKNFRVVIALVLGLVFVVPHITGDYPLGYDPVQVMNSALPSISLVSIAAVMLLLLMGLFGTFGFIYVGLFDFANFNETQIHVFYLQIKLLHAKRR